MTDRSNTHPADACPRPLSVSDGQLLGLLGEALGVNDPVPAAVAEAADAAYRAVWPGPEAVRPAAGGSRPADWRPAGRLTLIWSPADYQDLIAWRPSPAVARADRQLDGWRRDGALSELNDSVLSAGLVADQTATRASALALLARLRDDLGGADPADPYGDVIVVAAAVAGCAACELLDADDHYAGATAWERICHEADEYAAYRADGPDHPALAGYLGDRYAEADCRADDHLDNLRLIVEGLMS